MCPTRLEQGLNPPRARKFSSGIRGVRPVLNPHRAGKVDITRSYYDRCRPLIHPTPLLKRLSSSVISNIYSGGLPPAEAAAVIVEKACEILQQRAAGNRLEALLRRAESV